MGDVPANDSERPLSSDEAPTGPPLRLHSKITHFRNQPAQCTIFPPESSSFDRPTTWISAKEGDFVALEDRR